jgi:membrane protein
MLMLVGIGLASVRAGVPTITGARFPDAPTKKDDHNSGAITASEHPPRDWKQLLLRIYANISKHRVLALAAAMTYYSILAIFPAIAALVAMYGLFSDPRTIIRHLDQLGGFLPGGAIDIARDQLTPCEELEEFFRATDALENATDALENKELKFIGWRGPNHATKIINRLSK